MSDAWKAIVLGCVQGVTEFLPVSSSAHLLALRHILGFEVEGIAFDLAVHLATLLAVIIYFRRQIGALALGRGGWRVTGRLLLGTAPVVAAGLLFASLREDPSPWAPVIGWVFSGCYLGLSRGRGGSASQTTLSLPRVALVGLAQALSLFPGVSRSGSSITAGLWLGLAREEAARFSFLLAIPATLLAIGYQALKLLRSPGPHTGLWAAAGVAMPVAFVVGMLCIHLLLRLVRTDSFHRFGWYNLTAAAGLALYLLLAK